MLALGIVAAVGASLFYNTSIALQALEAREVPAEHALKPSLIGRLLRNRRWLGATALGFLGWPLEIAALLLAPLTVVQPCLASGLILLLWLGATKLGEAPGRREVTAVAAIVLGVAGVAWAAPERSTDHAGTAAIALALALVAIPIALPFVLRRRGAGTLAVIGAGCGYAWTAIASKLLTDELAAGAVLVAAAWLATAAVSEGLALLSEMSALQGRPGDPGRAGDVRGPGPRPGRPGAADLRGVVGVDAARRRGAGRLHGASRSAAPSCWPGSRAVGAVLESAHEDD